LYDSKDRKHYAYYQWVCFILFFQAILCYVPKWLWSAWEGGLMQTIVLGLNSGLKTAEERVAKKESITRLSFSSLETAQHVCFAILVLRGSVPRKHNWTALSNESLYWR